MPSAWPGSRVTSTACNPRATPRAIAGRVLLLAALAAGLGLVATLDVTVCPFANLTGLPCPGCGMTRAALALLGGDLTAAMALHPLSPIAVPVAFAFSAAGAVRFVAPHLRFDPLVRLERQGGALFLLATVALLLVWGFRFLGYLGGPVSVNGLVNLASLR